MCVNKPLVSVLIPIYNCEAYIEKALNSIVSQSYLNLEIILIDDASTDDTLKIVKKNKDPRIRIIEKKENTGYTINLNLGLSICKGKYIARMDGDDIALKDRITKQVKFLEDNPNIVLCGTQYNAIGKDYKSNHPLRHEEIKVGLINGSIIAHPSVMFLKSFLEEHQLSYDTTKEPAEDHDLWSRIIFLGQVANLEEPLLDYRVHDQQVSKKRKHQQITVSNVIKERMIKKIDSSFKLFNNIKFHEMSEIDSYNYYKKHVKQLEFIKKNNQNSVIYDVDLFNQFCELEIKQLDQEIIINLKNNSIFLLGKHIFNFRFFKNLGFINSAKFIIKSLLFRK